MAKTTKSKVVSAGYFTELYHITRGAGIALGGIIAEKGILFLYTIFLARKLGTHNLGIYALGISIVGILSVISNLGLNTGITRYVAIYSEKKCCAEIKGTVLGGLFISLISSLVIIGLVFESADLISANLLHKPDLAKILKIMSIAIPFDSFVWILLAATRGLKFMHYTAVIKNFCWPVLRLFFGILFLLGLGMEADGAAIAYVLSSIMAATLSFYFVNRLIPLTDSRVRPLYNMKSLLYFSIPMAFSILSGNFARQIDVFMLGIFSTASDVGIYSVIVRIIVLLELFFGIFIPIFNPYVTTLHQKGEIVKLSEILKTITRWNIMLSLPFFLSILLFPNTFLRLFGTEYSEATVCLIILVVGRLINSLSSLSNSIIFMTGKSKITLMNNLFILSINIILNYILIPQYGLLGAAFATSSCLILLAVIRISEVYHLWRIHPFSIKLLKPIIAGLAALSLSLLFFSITIIKGKYILFYFFPFFMTIYLFLIYIFKIDYDDINMIYLLKKKKPF